MSEDASEPGDAFARLTAAIDAGRQPLEGADLRALSGESEAVERVARERLAALEPAGRFAFVGQLIDSMNGLPGLEFTSVLRAALCDDDLSVRAAAATALASCETPGATEALLRAAASDEEDGAVRIEAVSALGEVALRAELGWASSERAEGVIPALRRIAEDSREEPALRAGAIAGAAVAQEEWIAPLLDDAYGSDEAELRLGALRGMGRNADDAWIPLIENAFGAADEDERMAAVEAAGEIGSEDAVPMLLDLLAEPGLDADLARAVARALGEIGGEEALEQLAALRTHPDPELRAAVAEALDEAQRIDGVFDSFDDDDAGIFK